MNECTFIGSAQERQVNGTLVGAPEDNAGHRRGVETPCEQLDNTDAGRDEEYAAASVQHFTVSSADIQICGVRKQE